MEIGNNRKERIGRVLDFGVEIGRVIDFGVEIGRETPSFWNTMDIEKRYTSIVHSWSLNLYDVSH